jgi:2-iminobutanoate/2-iminopropanoate deaminase
MPFIQRNPHATRTIRSLLCSVLLATAIAGCANSPKAMGIPWWPQGPGSTSEDLLRAAEAAPSSAGQAATQAHYSRAPATPEAGSQTQSVRYGDLLFVSGQTADVPASVASGGGDIETQVRVAMDNVTRILERHGLAISNIVAVTLYMRDIDDLPKADAVYASYFPRSLPARSVVGVNTLPGGSLIEISVIAGK